MMSRVTRRAVVLAGLVAAPSLAHAQGERVQVGFTTFHVAGLTTPRAAGDTTDAPFLLVTVLDAGTRRDTIVPGPEQHLVRLDGVIPPRALTELRLGDSDSALVEVSVLEHGDPAVFRRLTARPRTDGGAVTVSKDDPADRRIAPMLRDGAHHVGSVRLVLARAGGVTSWRRLECAASCRVLGAPADTPLARPVSGVVELTGAGGTYHLQLQAARAP